MRKMFNKRGHYFNDNYSVLHLSYKEKVFPFSDVCENNEFHLQTITAIHVDAGVILLNNFFSSRQYMIPHDDYGIVI